MRPGKYLVYVLHTVFQLTIPDFNKRKKKRLASTMTSSIDKEISVCGVGFACLVVV